MNLHICTTKYYVSPHFKIVKIHKILCIAQITLYCTQNIVNLYNYTNCIVLYTNCKIYVRRVVRIMHIILWMHLTRQYAQIILHRNKVKLLWMYITPQNEVNIQILKIQAIYISICKTACIILKNVCKIFCRILHNVLGFQNSIGARK